jgi:mannose-6-phosphate isomerase class I
MLPQAERALEGKLGTEPLKDHEKYIFNPDPQHNVISVNTAMAMNALFPVPIIMKLIHSKKKIRKFFEKTKEENFKTLAWTVQKEKHFNFLNEVKADYIITDKPYGRLATYLRKKD